MRCHTPLTHMYPYSRESAVIWFIFPLVSTVQHIIYSNHLNFTVSFMIHHPDFRPFWFETMAFSQLSEQIPVAREPDATPLIPQSPAARSYVVPAINVGVIGLLLYILGARLSGKALTVTALEWEDCEFIENCWIELVDWLVSDACCLAIVRTTFRLH